MPGLKATAATLAGLTALAAAGTAVAAIFQDERGDAQPASLDIVAAYGERKGRGLEFAVRVRGDADQSNPPLVQFDTSRKRKGPELFLTRTQGGDGLWSYRTHRRVAKARLALLKQGLLVQIRRSALPKGRLRWRAVTIGPGGRHADLAPNVGYLDERL
jgi:hypothetical protein